MALVPISSLPATPTISGAELVEIVQGGVSKRTTTGAIGALLSPIGTAPFVMAEATGVPGARRLVAETSVTTVTDGGAGGDITVGVAALGIGTAKLANNAVTDAKLRQSAALSLVGNATNATANVADIAAASDHQIMRRSGTAIGFGAIDLSQSATVGTSRLAYANLAQGSALSVLGVTGNATANLASIAAGTDHFTLRRSGTSLAFGLLNVLSIDITSATEDTAPASDDRLITRDTSAAANRYVTISSLFGAAPINGVFADRSYFISTTGNDSNDGLTLGTAWLTLQKAADVIKTLYIQAGVLVTVNIAAGTYTGPGSTNQCSITGWSGGGAVRFLGNPGTPSTITLSNNNNNVFKVEDGSLLGGGLFVRGFRMNTGAGAAGACVYNTGHGKIYVEDNEFGTCFIGVIGDTFTATLIYQGTNTVLAGSTINKFLDADECGIQCAGTTTIGAGVTIGTAFANARFGGSLVSQTTWVNPSNATGKRFAGSEGSSFITQLAGLNYFPGTVDGTLIDGADYDGSYSTHDIVITSSLAAALAVGLNGKTNPAFRVDASTASSASGWEIASNTAANAPALRVISSSTNVGGTINAKGTGTLTLQDGVTGTGGVAIATSLTVGAGATTQSSVASTGVTTIRNDNAGVTGTIAQENFGITGIDQGTTLTVRLGAGGALGGVAGTWQVLSTEDWSVSANRSSKHRFNTRIDDAATTELDIVNGITVRPTAGIPAGGATTLGLKATSTANFGVFFGSGAPSLSAAKGSLYLRSDGSSTSTRAYINTDGGTTWTAITTVA